MTQPESYNIFGGPEEWKQKIYESLVETDRQWILVEQERHGRLDKYVGNVDVSKLPEPARHYLWLLYNNIFVSNVQIAYLDGEIRELRRP